jgi:hypothetical protein
MYGGQMRRDQRFTLPTWRITIFDKDGSVRRITIQAWTKEGAETYAKQCYRGYRSLRIEMAQEKSCLCLESRSEMTDSKIDQKSVFSILAFKAEVAEAVHFATEKLFRETGLSPSAIEIERIDVSRIGGPQGRFVGG